MQSYPHLNGRGPVMFFSYFGPEEILFWTVRKTARDIAQPPNPNIWIDVYAQARERDTLPNDVFYADPDPDPRPELYDMPIDPSFDISRQHKEEVLQQEVDSILLEGRTPRIFNGDLWEVRNRGFMVANFHLQAILPGNAGNIRFRVAETDKGVYIHSALTYPREPFTDAAKPRFTWVGGSCQFSIPSDTFDLYLINLADTAKFRVMLDSTTIRITRQEVKLVIFKNNLLLRDPLDMFSIYVPWKMCRERAEWMKQVVKKCVKMGAKPVLMPSGFYSTRRGVKQILADSINAFVDKRDSAQVLFFHYTGLRAPIEKAVNAALEDPHFGITADVPLYFGPRSRRDDVIYPGIPKEF